MSPTVAAARLAADNLLLHPTAKLDKLLGMEDFIKALAKRRAQLLKELADLDTAERIFNAVGAESMTTMLKQSPEAPQDATKEKITIGQACLIVLKDAAPKGLRAMEILAAIQARWRPDLTREVLAPQLSRLGHKNLISRDQGLWFFDQKAEDRVRYRLSKQD